jgi:hypothetical protein
LLTILGPSQTLCDGISRRRLLEIGGAGLFGLTLPKVLAAEAQLAHQKPKAKSVIFLLLFGGPSQLETFDDSRTIPPNCKPNSGIAYLGTLTENSKCVGQILCCSHNDALV